MADDYFDLIVWYEPDGGVHGFQLCYDKPGRERALTWTLVDGFRHGRIDIVEYDPRANRTPVLLPEGSFPSDVVRAEFLSQSAEVSETIRTLVRARIDEFVAQGEGGAAIDRLPALPEADEPQREWVRLAVSLLVAIVIFGAVAILLSRSWR